LLKLIKHKFIKQIERYEKDMLRKKIQDISQKIKGFKIPTRSLN